MKITINIEKKHLYFLVTFVVVIIGLSYVIAYGTNNPSIFGHSAGELDLAPLYIDTVNSRIGIGTTSPDYTLQIGNRVWVTYDGSSGLIKTDHIYLDEKIYDGDSDYVTVDDGLTVSGNVGIGTTSPQAKLDVVGKVRGQGVTQQIQSQYWDLTATETGTATTWSNLPTDMALTVTTDASTIYIDTYISRVQHSAASVNTEYRITVDGTEVAKTNTGGHDSWHYRSLAFHGVASVAAGSHTIRVQYRTQSGTETWLDDSNGQQVRRLTVMEFKN